jgi:predicted PurR-regulated permease PerM
MEAAPLVTLIAVFLAIAVIAAFLITVIYQLYQVFDRLNTVLGVVGGVVEQTEALDPIISDIANNLAAGQAAIEASVERLKVRKGFESDNGSASTEHSAPAIPSSPPPTTTFTNY